jgi:hypothetical protein
MGGSTRAPSVLTGATKVLRWSTNSTYMAVQVGLCNYEIRSVSRRYPRAGSKLHDVLNQGYQGLLG